MKTAWKIHTFIEWHTLLLHEEEHSCILNLISYRLVKWVTKRKRISLLYFMLKTCFISIIQTSRDCNSSPPCKPLEVTCQIVIHSRTPHIPYHNRPPTWLMLQKSNTNSRILTNTSTFNDCVKNSAHKHGGHRY